MGSLTALECASRHPVRIARIALVGTAVPMPVSDALLGAAATRSPRRSHDQHLVALAARHHRRQHRAGHVAAGASRRLMERQQPGVLHNDLAACNAYTHGMEAAAALACPVLIISGSRT
jgi:pimeloyl-ACP methyl ester carboxylesterase